jgi:hypothetical protein
MLGKTTRSVVSTIVGQDSKELKTLDQLPSPYGRFQIMTSRRLAVNIVKARKWYRSRVDGFKVTLERHYKGPCVANQYNLFRRRKV